MSGRHSRPDALGVIFEKLVRNESVGLLGTLDDGKGIGYLFALG